MRVSASIELLWQLATQEATSARFGEIQPEHILAAILKVSELPVEEVERMAPGSDAAKELAGEVHDIRQALAGRSIDSKQARRKLRAELGRGNARNVGGPLHRSQDSRAVFDAAARLAEKDRSEILKTEHLLQALLLSPTPVIMKVLGNAARTKTSKHGETPLLDQYGQDLTRMAANGELPEVSGRQAECKAFMHTLIQANRRNVLLVCDNDEDVRVVVMAAAQAIAGPDAAAAMKDSRIVDVTALRPSGNHDAESLDRLGEVLAEAANSPEVILWVPAVQEASGSDQDGDQWNNLLRTTLAQGQLHCICRVSPEAYTRDIGKSAAWRRVAHVMWLCEEYESEIPREL